MSNSKRKTGKLLASLAVFGILNKNKKNIYEILEEFLVEIIKNNQLYKFNIAEVNNLLYQSYSFEIPDAVILTVLKKASFLKRDRDEFLVIDKNILEEFSLNDNEHKQEKINNKFIYDLNKYISEQKKISLSSTHKRDIIKAFTDFMLDKSIENEYSTLIFSFILEKQDDKVFVENLQTVKEGVLLYTGLQYSSNGNSTWKSPLSIYLSIDILFHLANYDGDVQALLFNDFYKLVKEINTTKKYISLKCLNTTKKEIEYFFATAERIVNKEERLHNLNNATAFIVKGCKNSTDILSKKVKFFTTLNNYGIIIDEEDDSIYNEEHHEFNIFSNELLLKYVKDDNEYSVKTYLEILNFISLKRGNKKKANFENCKYILLTDNYKLRKIAHDEDVKLPDELSLAYSLQYFTSRLWFRLNKGFGNNIYPSTFHVITKAQVLLGGQVKNKINEQYRDLQERKDMSQEEAIIILSELKDRLKTSDKIKAEDVSLMIDTIEEDSILSYAKEHSEVRRKAIKGEEEKVKLEDDLNNTSKEKDNLIIKNKKLIEEMIIEKKKSLNYLIDKEQDVLRIAGKKYNFYKVKLITIGLLFNVFLISMIFLKGWDIMEPIIWIITLSSYPTMLYIYLLSTERKFSFLSMLNNRKVKIVNEIEIQENFDYEEIINLKKEIDNLIEN